MLGTEEWKNDNNAKKQQKSKKQKNTDGTPERFRLPPHKLVSGEKGIYVIEFKVSLLYLNIKFKRKIWKIKALSTQKEHEISCAMRYSSKKTTRWLHLPLPRSSAVRRLCLHYTIPHCTTLCLLLTVNKTDLGSAGQLKLTVRETELQHVVARKHIVPGGTMCAQVRDCDAVSLPPHGLIQIEMIVL